ncbi:4Fe-4S single cluster domain-containing protein [Frigoribacterium faeni]|uniref:4Fe-4S single cluster domain-containing protein n=1 Tax=Frigoribacterium faeni TaxID=145483 RepID=UPI0024132D54|nr:4Fe-4S single cluster domain-containing protein [Frigoribacterium faeni]
MNTVRVGRVLHGTTAEGPGLRSAIWTQGCSIRCAGCINPQLFSSRGGRDVSAEELIDAAQAFGVEGITLLGGEPFDQSDGLAVVAEMAHAADLGVICFTGYQHESLALGPEGHRRFLAAIDLLVDGPYLESEPEGVRALVGSSNQRFIHLTERYRDYDPTRSLNRIDVRIGPDGSVEMAGFLDSDGLAVFSASLGVRRRRKP